MTTAPFYEIRHRVEQFHADYCAVLDANDIEAWPAFFEENGVYRLIARDNKESGMTLCLMLCEGMGMLKDRAYAIAHTEMFAPRYVHHNVSLIRIVGVEGNVVTSEANYQVFETLIDEPTKILQVGRYRDQLVLTGDRVLIRERECVFDTVVVPNCVVYPV